MVRAYRSIRWQDPARQRGTQAQYHEQKDESSYLLSGRLLLEQGDSAETMRRRVLEPGAAWRNAPRVVHTIEALDDSVILEVSTPELHDLVCIEDRYGRAQVPRRGAPLPNNHAPKYRRHRLLLRRSDTEATGRRHHA